MRAQLKNEKGGTVKNVNEEGDKGPWAANSSEMKDPHNISVVAMDEEILGRASGSEGKVEP